MPADLRTALQKRRSYYGLRSDSPVTDDEIKEMLDFAILHTPSAFNSQSARLVLLLGDEHKKLWEIVRRTLRQIVPAGNFAPTDAKIASFAAGHGTVLFFEDQAVIAKLQADYPTYKDAFPGFSMNSTGMLQYVVWVMLRDAGLGASLQHYGNLIGQEVASVWNLDPRWLLIAQMPFGTPTSEPGPKDQLPLDERVKVFC